jgi:predicted DNA-binding transcriptional regulator YafY
MSDSSYMMNIISSQGFWVFLKSLDSLNENAKLADFLLKQNVSVTNYLQYKDILHKLSIDLESESSDGEKWIAPLNSVQKLGVNHIFSEWLAFKSHFPHLSEEQPTNKFIVEEIRKESWANNLTPNEEKKLQELESALKKKAKLEIELEGKSWKVYPHRLVFMDGHLSLISEDCIDRCLSFFKFDQIKVLKTISNHQYKVNFTSFEVNDFIFAMRAVAGSEERLVLKILDKNVSELNPPYQMLGNPYITTNAYGQQIWAASIEKSELLIDWLISLEDKVEILDPQTIKKEVAGRKNFKQAC